MDETDAQLQLKKRARRRLVGAVAFVSVVAVVLPMVMDHEPRQQVHDVEIRIPGQDEKPFAPKFAVAPVDIPAPRVVEEPRVVPVPLTDNKPEVVKERIVEKLPEKMADKPVDKVIEKPPAKAAEKPAEKVADKAPVKNDAEAKRAAAILAGQAATTAPSATTTAPAAKSGEYVVLIGAFANEANVRSLKTKLSEQNIKTFSEPLDTPQGKKTRVRAGPFPNREAAEKALEKMQRIGVSGVVSAK